MRRTRVPRNAAPSSSASSAAASASSGRLPVGDRERRPRKHRVRGPARSACARGTRCCAPSRRTAARPSTPRAGSNSDEVRRAPGVDRAAVIGRAEDPGGRGGQRLDRARAVEDAPGSTSSVSTTASAVSSPIVPGGDRSNSASFSSTACGAWSVAIASIVPSASPSAAPRDPRRVRSGGCTLRFVSYVDQVLVGEHEVVRRDLGGHPHALGLRAADAAPPTARVDRWHRCSRPPVSAREREVARDDDLLGLGGPPREAQRAECSPSCICPPSDERGVLGVLGDHDLAGNALAYRARCAASAPSARTVPSSVNIRTPASTISPISASASPASPCVIAPDREDVARARGASARSRTSCDDRRVVGDGIGVRHRRDRGEPAHGRGPRCPSRSSPCARSPARAGACADRRGPARARDRAPSTTLGAVGRLACRRSRPSATTHVAHLVGAARRDRPPARPSNSDATRSSPRPSPAAAEQQVQQRHADRDPVRHLLLDHGLAADRRRRSRSRPRGSSAPDA